MDRWKSRGGKSQRGEEKNRQDQRRERVRRKRMQVREKVEKLRIVFPMICGSGGSKSRLAKAAGAEPSGQMRDESCTPLWHEAHLWSKSKCTKHTMLGALLEDAMSKKCTPLWREAKFEVKMYKAPHTRSKFGSCDVEKVRAVVRRDARFEVKMHRLEVEMSKKCTPLWGEAHFEVKSAKNWRVPGTFGRSDVVFPGRRKGLCTLSKGRKNVRVFLAVSKAMAGVGHLKKICKDTFRMAGAVQETHELDMLGGQGADFQRRGCILEHQIFRFAKVILRDRCSTSYDLASLLRGRRNILSTGGMEKSQNALVRGRQLCTQLSTFAGSLAELLHFWCRQLRKMRKSRRIVSFLTLWSSKIREVSQNCCVFDVVKFKNWGSLDR